MKYFILALFFSNILSINAQIFSPDNNLQLIFKSADGKPVYLLNYKQKAIIKESTIGIDLSD
ncbi:MAG: glycoside hydrolase family 97 N-terminal domain-containing protein, partial [Ignavibacteriaceae bacterium]|nr:glycoside hydrolase family 97 N-terminal domain-containing protein [Ignavibacteriaceae bacterium]